MRLETVLPTFNFLEGGLFIWEANAFLTVDEGPRWDSAELGALLGQGFERLSNRQMLHLLAAAVSNLVDNAIKYSGSAVQVLVETQPVDDKFVSVRVRDQGPGIAKMELKQIFKRFYRVPGPLATRVKGTGLGLFIVRSVAKRHGGRAWAESEGPGRGSTFILQLPIVRIAK